MRGRLAAIVLTIAALGTSASCTSSGGGVTPTSTAATSSTEPAPSPASEETSTPAPTTVSASPSPSTTLPSSSASSKPAPAKSSISFSVPPASPAGSGPVIVLDPGHAPTTTGTDAKTGLPVSEYENEPEMRDVWAVAQLVKKQLVGLGYRVVFTKKHLTDHINLAQRAAVANKVHAALAVSIHDQGGSNGGLPFETANNIVYYQRVGAYRENPSGTKIVFNNRAVAKLSKRYGVLFQDRRASIEGHPVRLQGDIGYDAGTRGLAPGNMWIVQLLSQVPWIYNEAGGNSAGRTGLSDTDKQRYATGLVASIIACVPVS